MSNRVFVGGISYNADNSDLEAAMSHFGEVKEAKIINDRDTGQSKGFGFVTFEDEKDAGEAVSVGEVEICGRTARIDIANERPERSGFKGRGGNRGGGRNRR